MSMPDRRRWVQVAAAIVLAGACSASSSDSSLAPAPPVVTVTLQEYRLDYDPEIPSGRVVFRLVNAGRIDHRPSLVPLTDDIPPIDQQVRGEQRAVISPFAGVPTREPGEVGMFAVDLEPGQRYAFVCFARDADDNESHALQGMTSEFRVPVAEGATTSTSLPPPPDTEAAPG